ncbi:hypothetical protein JCM9140_1390 [Halalkalibacter wakoensis JCM 9140]|uniref:WG repeat-containing protein n=1 Tax=Halalkalibacter wakoensis JCM 9140 TaxID=1236970 RepID=W4Q103_9BACI|nr:WG repeat-containing protein [Halalkalibacter wakoensis]GAE25398.1 hypothetical protein JCM9140_1390 [Halalkalibacter wakoensis JCM 9140]
MVIRPNRLLASLGFLFLVMLVTACNESSHVTDEEGEKPVLDDSLLAEIEEPQASEIDNTQVFYSFKDPTSELYGYINSNGEVIISPKFDQAFDFSDGLGRVTVVDDDIIKIGFIDENGDYVIEPQYREARDFSEGLAAVNSYESEQTIGYINKQGEKVLVFDQFHDLFPFSDGMAVVGVWEDPDDTFMTMGYINKEGEVVKEPQYRLASDFSEGFARVDDTEKGYFIDLDGEVLIEAEERHHFYCGFSEGLACIKDEEERWGFFDKNGDIVIEHQFERVDGFSEGLAPVQIDWKWGFIDKEGNIIITPDYDIANRFSEGLAWIRKEDKWGAIDQDGTVLIEPYYDYAEPFKGGLARVFVEEQEQFVNRNGEVVFKVE